MKDQFQTDKMSEYGKFFFSLCGYKFYFDGRRVSKSDLYDMGYRDGNRILNGQTTVVAKRKKDIRDDDDYEGAPSHIMAELNRAARKARGVE